MSTDVSNAANGSQPQAPAMPLFYRQIAVIDTVRHAAIKLSRDAGYGFAAKTNAILLCNGEFHAAAQTYPIVFSSGVDALPLVICGFSDDRNLFVTGEGSWRPNAYIPAYVRRYPFIFVQNPASNELLLGVEEDSDRIGTTQGTPLFDDGKPSDALREALTFCTNYQDQVVRTQEFGAALHAAGVLEEQQAQINFPRGGTAQMGGFRVISPAKFDALDDATFLDWRRRGWLPLVFAHFHSMGQWQSLIEILSGKAAS
jgi:hypothetical protein